MLWEKEEFIVKFSFLKLCKITGTDNMAELERLRDVRNGESIVELTNRLFLIKLNTLLDDIIKKKVYGDTVARIWVIEYRISYY